MKKDFSESFEYSKKMWSVETNLPTSFTVKYSFDVFNPSNHDLIKYCNNSRCLMIVDKNVHKIYSAIIKKYFKTLKIELRMCIIDSNESNKNWKSADKETRDYCSTVMCPIRERQTELSEAGRTAASLRMILLTCPKRFLAWEN